MQLAEIALLQGLFYSPDNIPLVMDVLPSQSLSVDGQTVYRALCDVYTEGADPDVALVMARAEKIRPGIIGNIDVGSLIGGDVFTAENWPAHVETLVAGMVSQLAVTEAGRIAGLALRGANVSDLPGLFHEAGQTISAACMGGQKSTNDMAGVSSRYIDSLLGTMNGDQSVAIPTFIPGLDEPLKGGWHRQLLHTIFGPPGTGKSAIAVWATLMAALRGDSTLFLSLEMPEKELMDRFVSILSGVAFQSIELDPASGGDRPLREAEWNRMITSPASHLVDVRPLDTLSKMAMAMSSLLADLPIFIYDTPMDMDDIRSRSYSHASQHPTGLIVIDHMRMLSPGRGDGNKYDLLDDAFVSLAEIAKRTDAAVIALSQPKAELEVGAVPTMRHLSYAGDKPSNRLLGLQVAGGMGTRWRQVAVHVLKNRNGPSGGVVRFTMDMATFTAFASGQIAQEQL